jgi:hypothetical protein
MTAVALLASLAAYSVVASQPLFYLVAMSRAQRALSAAAYIELRQAVNPVMGKRVPPIYLAALLSLVALAVFALRAGDGLRSGAAGVALACLVVDLILMTRVSVPINAAIDAWTAADHPADWQKYRERWFGIFAYREAALLVGFASLLVGAAFGGVGPLE